ncbi:YciI family protein [Fructilactobacillus ixorae]|uniref:YciI family protein n=1 Tax=Fructilactobacillus ixorae TaxID=1750535 RepID=A0ABY5C2Y5_9LACO|nr:YciI family protein [Fructilactobacillus ixorae]USS92937.1 YciI family protein [Fructilactobacillus ixorae]
MFIIELTYQKPLAEVDQQLAAHNAYLDRNYAAGNFLLSGRKEPRDGGLILATVASRTELEAIYHQDPFYQHQLAQYRIVEFHPSKATSSLQAFINA